MARITISNIDSFNADSFVADITDNEYILVSGGLGKVCRTIGKGLQAVGKVVEFIGDIT